MFANLLLAELLTGNKFVQEVAEANFLPFEQSCNTNVTNVTPLHKSPSAVNVLSHFRPLGYCKGFQCLQVCLCFFLFHVIKTVSFVKSS